MRGDSGKGSRLFKLPHQRGGRIEHRACHEYEKIHREWPDPGFDDADQHGDKRKTRPKTIMQPMDAALTNPEGEHGEAHDGGDSKGYVSSVGLEIAEVEREGKKHHRQYEELPGRYAECHAPVELLHPAGVTPVAIHRQHCQYRRIKMKEHLHMSGFGFHSSRSRFMTSHVASLKILFMS